LNELNYQEYNKKLDIVIIDIYYNQP